jgi:hypothetical protein
MSQRTDAHCLKNLLPEDYNVLSPFYNVSLDTTRQVFKPKNERVHLTRDRLPTGNLIYLEKNDEFFKGNYHNKMTCDHCGAAFCYGYIVQHTPSGEYLVIGHVCAGKTFSIDSNIEYALKLMRKEIDRQAKREKTLVKKEKFLKKNNWVQDAFNESKARSRVNYFVKSLEQNLNRYGSLTQCQLDSLKRTIEKDREYDKAQKEAIESREEIKASKRIKVTGKVISIKSQYNYFDPAGGICMKMLVATNKGQKIFGSLPQNIDHVGRGQTVEFIADVEPSKKDKFFGYFKRPTKAEIK